MNRRGLLFMFVLLLCFIGVYLQPVISYKASPQPVQPTAHKEPPSTTLNTQKIATEGLAVWIGQSITQFEQFFGEATSVTESGFGFQNRTYQTPEMSYLEIVTTKQKINSIKVLRVGELDITPFHFRMNLQDVTKFTTISPNVTLTFQGASYSLELMEDDMNYRPLVAFENDSYAILFFDHRQPSSGLYSVMYLDAETLIKLSPYLITEGADLHYVAQKDADWEQINRQNMAKSLNTMQRLRKDLGFERYQTDFETQKASEEMLTLFLENPEEILSTERLQSLQRVARHEEHQTWVLSNKEAKNILDTIDSSATIHFEMPVYDPIFTILSWYNNPYLVTHLYFEELESIGVAFSKENVLVLFQEVKNTTESSD